MTQECLAVLMDMDPSDRPKINAGEKNAGTTLMGEWRFTDHLMKLEVEHCLVEVGIQHREESLNSLFSTLNLGNEVSNSFILQHDCAASGILRQRPFG